MARRASIVWFVPRKGKSDARIRAGTRIISSRLVDVLPRPGQECVELVRIHHEINNQPDGSQHEDDVSHVSHSDPRNWINVAPFTKSLKRVRQ